MENDLDGIVIAFNQMLGRQLAAEFVIGRLLYSLPQVRADLIQLREPLHAELLASEVPEAQMQAALSTFDSLLRPPVGESPKDAAKPR
jgi:hypothetical protein